MTSGPVTSGPVTWRSLLGSAAERLGSDHEARILLEEASGAACGQLSLLLAAEPSRLERDRLAELLERRGSGEPLQHVVGHWSFRSVELLVDSRALVPRPETEVVVGHVLDLLASRRAAAGAPEPLRALDLGTGSGAIACALVAEADDLHVVGVDLSAEALALAEENRRRLPPDWARRISLRRGDWYRLSEGPGLGSASFDCVVANPPYLASHERDELEPVVRDHDPALALFAGPTGLEAIEAVVGGAQEVLVPGGSLVVEIAPHQAPAARVLARRAGACRVEVARDLAGRDRVLLATW